jgi:hypothetical protein
MAAVLRIASGRWKNVAGLMVALGPNLDGVDCTQNARVDMRIDIEFFRSTDAALEGRTVRVNSGQFGSVKDAEIYGMLYHPRNAEGFRIM